MEMRLISQGSSRFFVCGLAFTNYICLKSKRSKFTAFLITGKQNLVAHVLHLAFSSSSTACHDHDSYQNRTATRSIGSGVGRSMLSADACVLCMAVTVQAFWPEARAMWPQRRPAAPTLFDLGTFEWSGGPTCDRRSFKCESVVHMIQRRRRYLLSDTL
eukprot:409850-Pleurochrysis_carterae.AAC.1